MEGGPDGVTALLRGNTSLGMERHVEPVSMHTGPNPGLVTLFCTCFSSQNTRRECERTRVSLIVAGGTCPQHGLACPWKAPVVHFPPYAANCSPMLAQRHVGGITSRRVLRVASLGVS
eukprot:3748533-Amphidinium_carterae.1